MDAGTVIAIISSGIKFLDSMKEKDFQSRVLRNFEELKSYVKLINQKVDFLILQNQVIIDKLDALPNQILRITDGVVGTHLLEERYANIQGRIILYTSISDWENWENSYEGWNDYWKDLNYLFLREFRLGQMPRLIPACELAVAVYREFATPVVKILVKQKIERLQSAQKTFEENISEYTLNLLRLLNNKEYISSHIFNSQLDNLNQDLHVGLGHRNKTIQYTEQFCEEIKDPDCCRSQTVCKQVVLTKEVPDSEYNLRYDNHITKINSLQKLLISSTTQYVEISLICELLENYYKSLAHENEKSIRTDKATLVLPGPDEILTKGLNSAPFNLFMKRRPECY